MKIKPKELMFTMNISSKQAHISKHYRPSLPPNKDLSDFSFKSIKIDSAALIANDCGRAKSLRNTPVPFKFKSPTKTPENSSENTPFNIRFAKLDEIRKKIVSKLLSKHISSPPDHHSPTKLQTRKISPDRRMESINLHRLDLSRSSKFRLADSSTKVLEKFTYNTPFIAAYYQRKTPKIDSHAKLL